MEKELNKKQQGSSSWRKESEKDSLSRLIGHAQNGNREALKNLCESIAKSVFFHVSFSIRNQMDAEDVTQEILIRVCENLHNLKDTKAFSGWLNSIILNEIRRHIAKNAKHSAVINLEEYFEAGIEDDDEEFIPEDYAIREEDRKVVMEIVRNLPERQLEAVILH